MFLPLVERQLVADPLVGWNARKCKLAPLPPNIEAPAGIAQSRLYHRLARARAAGQLVIGHFGSIYPGKQPNALLGIGAILAERGESPLIVYIGSFIRGMDRVEERFYARAAELGIPIQSLSPAMQSRTTKHSGCSARSTPSAICSTKA
jgi:hypothetical protein